MSDYRATLLALQEHLQCQMEAEMKQAGADRYRAAMSRLDGGHESFGPTGQRLVAGSLVKGAAAIRSAVSSARAGNPTRRALAIDVIGDKDSRILSMLTARALVDGFSADRPLTAVARRLGGMVEEEMRLDKFAEANPGAFAWTMERMGQEVGHQKQWARIKNLMNLKGIHWEPWGTRKCILVGLWLLDQFNGATGMFAVELGAQAAGKKKSYVLQPKPETLAWLAEASTRMELSSTEFWPMVSPPKPWDRPWGGGYLTKLVPTQSLVKMRRDQHAREYMRKLKHADMSAVYEAVNHVQDTAWRLNRDVLAVLSDVERLRMDVEGLPPAKDAEMLPYPFDGAKVTAPLIHRDWCKRAGLVYRANRENRSRRIQLTRTLMMANKFKDFDHIYFPHTMDFRGRMYPLPAFLNPQGCDFQKALLLFAEGKPIDTQEALEWLAVHGANSYGIDKVPFDDRWNWVVDHQTAIEIVTIDPLGLGFNFWSTADAPFQFLAWCFEWVRVMQGGWGTVSSLPVAVDGSCNG